MKKLMALLLAVCLVFGLVSCADVGLITGEDGGTLIITDEDHDYLDTKPGYEETEPEITEQAIDPDGWYYSAEDVALYIHTYGRLPENYITKDEARDLGWSGGSVEDYAPGFAIGGDRFGNREGLLPDVSGRRYYECDIDTNGRNSRGAKRIVFSNDGLIFYTEDHYDSFTQLYGEGRE